MATFDEEHPVKRPPLAVVRERHAELETCAFCPRLCRAACPVSNAEPREALTPFGKMTSLLSTERDASNLLAYACTGCGACTTACRHENPVAEVLLEGRAALADAGRSPAVAERVAREHPSRVLRQSGLVQTLRADPAARADATTALLLGCPVLRGPAETAERILHIAARLAGEPVRLLSECCGAVPTLAGDPSGAERSRERLARELAGTRRLVVADPGCLRGVLPDGEPLSGSPEPLSLLAWAAGNASLLARVAEPGVRYGFQMPCWARGTAAEPAALVLLEHLVGTVVTVAPGCSGGGGLLPVTYPEVSRAIAKGRAAEFAEHGVDKLVTGCAAGARRFRALDGAPTLEVVELTTLLWEGLQRP